MKYKFRKDNHLGTMRFDYADGDTCVANTWFPYGSYSKEDISEFQEHCNEIIFKRFTSFSKIVSYCGGEGFLNETHFEEETDNYIYDIKLIPVKGEYNGYIFVHRKDAA